MGNRPTRDVAEKKEALEAVEHSGETINEDPRKTYKKVLLLSGSQAGKTTIFKQFVLAYGGGYDLQARSQFVSHVIENVVVGARALVEWAQKLELQLNPKTEASAEHVKRMDWDWETRLTETDIAHLERVWEDDAILEANSKLDRSNIQETVEYFLNKIRVIAKPDYVPNDQDILRVRVRTTGVNKSMFDVPESPVLLHDVGGERNERRKWFHYIDDVDAIIYVFPIADYNRLLFEDETTNRLVENLDVFEQLMNIHWFDNTSLILVFTKRDIFEKKFDKNVLKSNFPEFEGSSFEDGYKFFEDLFKSRTKDPVRIDRVERLNAVDPDEFLSMMGRILPIQRLDRISLLKSLDNSVRDGDFKSVELCLSKSTFLCSLVPGSLGATLFSVALSQCDLLTMNVLVDYGFSSPIFSEDLSLEQLGRNEEALIVYQERLSSIDDNMESLLAVAVAQYQVFLPSLAGKYRVKARLELESSNFDAFFRWVDMAWLFHVKGHTRGCDHLWWVKGSILRERGNHSEALSVFEGLLSKCSSSPLYSSFGLYEFGLYEDAYSNLKDMVLDSKEVMCLAQASRCLLRMADVSSEARSVYRRLRVFGVEKYFKSQHLTPSEVKFVTQVINRMTAFGDNHLI